LEYCTCRPETGEAAIVRPDDGKRADKHGGGERTVPGLYFVGRLWPITTVLCCPEAARSIIDPSGASREVNDDERTMEGVLLDA
jgi:hypothetical protein